MSDTNARRALLPLAINTVTDHDKLETLAHNVKLLAKPHAAADIADRVIALAEAGR